MRRLLLTLRRTIELHWRPPQQVFLGLFVLLLGMMATTAPMITAMALVGLGAIGLATDRYRNPPARQIMLVAHLAIYGALYLLFVGAMLDAASRHGGLSPAVATDLTLSLGPVSAAATLAARTFIAAEST